MKTNKEYRSDLAKELYLESRKMNNNLEQVDRLPISEELKEEARKQITGNFWDKYGKTTKKPKYIQAEKTHREEEKTKSSLKKLRNEKETIQAEYLKKLEEIDAEILAKEAEYNKALIAHRTTGKMQTEVGDNFEDIKAYVMSTEKVDKGVAEKLINMGHYPFVIYNIEKFEGLDRKFLAESALNNGWHVLIATNLNKFEGLGLDYKEIANKLIENNDYSVLTKNLQNFQSLDSEIAINLLKHGYIQNLLENFDSFTTLDKNVAAMLIEAGYRNIVVDNIDRFEKIDIKDIEKSVVDKLYTELLNIRRFNVIDKTINNWIPIYDNYIIAEVLLEHNSYALLEGKLGVLNIDKETSDKIKGKIKSYENEYQKKHPGAPKIVFGNRRAPVIPLEDEENGIYRKY